MSLKEFKENNYQEFFQAVDAIPCNPTGDNGDDWFGYIAKRDMDLDAICQLIDLNNPKIVDLGCGYCENLLYLGSYFDSPELHGIEMNSKYIGDMESLIATHGLDINIHSGNVLSQDISGYDLLYSFCPAQSTSKYNEFNSYVLNNMKVGAYWLETHNIMPGNQETTIHNHINDSFTVLLDDGLITLLKKN